MRHNRPYVHTRSIVSAICAAFAGLAFCSALPRVSAADGFVTDRQSEAWSTVLAHMPPVWRRARRVEVRWVSDREMSRLVEEQQDEDNQRGDDSTIQGFYDRAKNDHSPATITIRANLARLEAIFVLSHEFAHMVWDDVLSRRDRTEYRSIWDEQRHDRRLVSRYAAESPEEGFAEAVAAYLWERDKLRRRDDLSFEFVSGLVNDTSEQVAGKR